MALVVKNPPANAVYVRDSDLIPESEKSPGGEHTFSDLLQYSCLENPMDRGAWQAAGHRISKSWTRLRQFSTHALL